MKMPFGKHKGKELNLIERDNPEYLVWLHENCDLTGKLATEVKRAYPACLQEKDDRIAEKMIKKSRNKAFRNGGGYIDFLGNFCGEDGYDDPNFGYTEYDDYGDW